MKKTLFFIAISIFTMLGTASADVLYGSCQNSSGEKCTNVHRISTSWNSQKGYPSDGTYSIDLGPSVNSRITVYCDGKKVGTVYVKGSTKFDIVCR